jgi:hypothetical protein
MKRVALAMMLGSLLLVGSVAHAAPKKAPSGTGAAAAACWADPGTAEPGQAYDLVATGLPTDTALNIGITIGGTEVIYPFGMSATGNERFQETAVDYGTVTYRFLGPLRGNAKVYASCSMHVA